MKHSVKAVRKKRGLKKRNLKKCLLVLSINWIIILFGWTAAFSGQEWYSVKWVADGDTIFLADGRHIRLIGINAPEVDHKDAPGEPFGNAARKALSKLVAQSKVRLEWDEIRKDRYGRQLAHVYDRNNRLLSQILVAEGLAHVLFHRDNQRYFDKLLLSQKDAMAKKKGFWRAFRFDNNPKNFAGNKRSLRFHLSDCEEAKKIGRRNRISLPDAWSAFENGYAPAKGCLKGIGMFIK